MTKKELIFLYVEKLANFKNFITFYRPKYRLARKLLKQNAEFKNIHKGERCFIIGNGPSLNTEDLSVLKDEVVFTVNQISRHPKFKSLKTSYHFWADPAFFRDGEHDFDHELLEVMKNVKSEDNSPICFYPAQYYDFIKKHKLDVDMKARYFLTRYSFYDGYKSDIDYTEGTPGFGTVILWCITMAIYMGFAEIYLLGCDGTGLINSIQSATRSKTGYEYVYDMTENEKERYFKLLDTIPLERYVLSYLNCLLEYRAMVKYCAKRNISLVNCSSTTAIQSIPRKALKDVLATPRK